MSTDEPATTFSVWRQDDNGNAFVVQAGLTEAEAKQLVADMEATGHKQIYWVSTDEPNRPSAH